MIAYMLRLWYNRKKNKTKLIKKVKNRRKKGEI